MKYGFSNDVKFGLGVDDSRRPSDVKPYKLSPEEHAKYLEDEPRQKARKLARANTWITPKEIAAITGLDIQTAKKIVYYERQQKHIKDRKKRPFN